MSVVGMTMVWSVGLSAFVPAGVAAASCPELVAGDLFKVPTVKSNPATTAVYLLTSDMKRLYFPKSEVFESWYGSFANVQIKEIPSSCLDAYDLAGGVNFRPGSRLLKTPLNPTIWAVAPGNMKVKVTDGNVLAATYGSNWNTMVSDWSDQWFANLTSSAGELTKLHDGQVVKKANDATVYYVWNGMLKKVDGSLPSFVSKDVRTVSDATFNALSVDSTTVTPATVTANPAQRSGSTTGTTPATGGALSVSLAADTPVQPAGGLADGTAFNKVLKVSLRASSKDVKVTGLTITRTGLFNNTNITGVSVWNSAGYRKGNVMTSFNSNNQVTVGFASDPILVAAGSTEVVTVAFNISGDADSGSVGASIADKAHIMTDASSVEGTFPIAGNIMSVVNGSNSLAAFTVTSTAVGGATSAGNPSSDVTANVSVGDTREIGKFRFSETTGRNDLAVKGIVFFLEGNARDKDFTNFEVLGQDNTVLGKTEYAGNRYVTVMFTSPYIVPQSQNRTVTLRAKVSDGSGNYLRAKIQNDFDVMVEDNALHYQILPTSFVSTGSSDGYFKVREGSLSLSKAQASKSGNVSAGATDVELASFDVTAVGEDIEIQKIGVGITTSGPNVTMPLTGNLRLVADNGDTLAQFAASSGSDALYTGGSQRNLSQYWTIPSGQTKKLYVRGDISTNATSTGYLVSVGNFYGRRVSSQTYMENQPSSSNVGTAANTVTVQASNLSVSKDTSLGNATVSTGRTGVVLAQFVVQAGSAEGVRLTNVSLKNSGTASALEVKNLKVLMGTSTASLTQVGTTINTPATSSNSFALEVGPGSVPASGVKIVQVVGDIGTGANTADTYSWTIDSHTYIGLSTNNPTTVDTDVTGQTMTVGAANVIISAVNDTTTVSKIRTPSAVPMQLGKWKIEAQNEKVYLNRITFQVSTPGGVVKTDASEYGTLYLYDADNMSAPLAETTYNNGVARFNSSNMLPVEANQTKYFVLMGKINGSGSMSPATTSAFFIASPSSTTNFEILRSAGGLVENGALDFGTVGATYQSNHATSTFYLFHNSAPKIVSESIGTSLEQTTQAQIFRFTVTNEGDRPLKISTTTINVQVSGLLASGALTGTGTIYAFELHDANGAGFNSTVLATSSVSRNTNSSAGATGSACLAGGIGATASDAPGNCVNATTSSLNLVFGPDSDNQNAFEDMQLGTVAPGNSRTFVLTANTSNMAAGKTTYSSTVTVSAGLLGASGYEAGNANYETNWADGVMTYFYTPVNGSINTTAYTASDSYPVKGPSLTRSI